MTQEYIGVKQIMAWPERKANTGEEGYAVKHPDGYTSWSPRDQFERAYMPMGEGANPTKINADMVERMMSMMTSERVGNNAVVHVTLTNGLTITESSGCVEGANYDHDLGVQMAMQKVRSQIWFGLGFALAWARHGLYRPITSDETDVPQSASAG